MIRSCPKCKASWIYPTPLRNGAKIFVCSNWKCRYKTKQRVRVKK